MKKRKIIIGSIFLVLIFITAIAFLTAAIGSYNYDKDPANGVDILEGFGAAMCIVLGGLVILCEVDIFFTVYYFFATSKTLFRSIVMIVSQLMLLLVFFSGPLVKFLSEHVSDIFREETIVLVPIFFLYVILRITCIAICLLSPFALRMLRRIFDE